MFWLVKEPLLPSETSEEEIQPIGNLEFYLSMTLIASALVALSLVFRTFPF